MAYNDQATVNMELFQIIKRYTRQSALNFQKCYEPDKIMMAGGWGPKAV